MDLGLNKHATRMLTGLVMGTIALLCIKYGGLALLCLIAIFVTLASKEYVQILQHKGFYPSLKMILFADAIFAAIAYFNRFDLVPLAFTVGTLLSFMWVLFCGRQPYIANVATTTLGFVYSGWFPLYFLFLRDLGAEPVYNGLLKINSLNDFGCGAVVFLFTGVLLTDIGCYYFGTKLGKHKLAAVISPNKTVEGSLGGGLCAILGCMLVGYFIDITWYHALIGGLLVTVFAQIGDLCESLIKRDAGVKDSGNALPGHGGFLDRTDSFIFTIPVLFYYFQYFVLSDSLVKDFVTFVKGIF